MGPRPRLGLGTKILVGMGAGAVVDAAPGPGVRLIELAGEWVAARS